MVHYVVVATIYASAVRAFFQSLLQAFNGGVGDNLAIGPTS